MRSRLPRSCLFVHILILCVAATFAARAIQGSEAAVRSFGTCWLPDSSKVAFILSRDNRTDCLYIADSDGSRVQPIFEGERFQAVAWAPNGKQLAVVSAPAGSEAVVYVMDAEGTGRETIKLGRTARNLALGWSTDSTRIVVQSDLSILLVRLKDKNVENLDDIKPAVSRVFFNGVSPLSPDNKLLLAAGPVDLIAWALGYRPVPISQAEAGGDLHVWLIKIEGKRHTLPVMHYGRLAGSPVWAPNGRAIAFMTETPPHGSTGTRTTPRFWMNMVSEVGTLLIDPIWVGDPISTTPAWSPAGTAVAYFWSDPIGRCMLKMVNPAFSTVIPLEERLTRVLFTAWNEPASIFLIAVTADEETVCATVDLNSGEFIRSSTLSVPFRHIVPSPDLTRLLLTTRRGEKMAFEIYDLDTGRTVQLLR